MNAFEVKNVVFVLNRNKPLKPKNKQTKSCVELKISDGSCLGVHGNNL